MPQQSTPLHKESRNVTAEWLTLLLRIWEVLGLSLGPDSLCILIGRKAVSTLSSDCTESDIFKQNKIQRRISAKMLIYVAYKYQEFET
jgi:hypothetical protein